MVKHAIPKLTKNQVLVMNTLASSKEPMSAYKILDALREEGFRAPLQVYRAIDKLLKLGLAHKLESLNAFVACNHSGCDDENTVAFMICDSCSKVDEITSSAINNELNSVSEKNGFRLQSSIVELHGNCADCEPGNET